MTYSYIMYKSFYYVPRMPSLCAARERNEAFKERFDVEPLIVSDLEWNYLSENYDVMVFGAGDV